MVHEALSKISEHLKSDPNEKYQIGGQMIETLANYLLQNDNIPKNDGTKVLLPGEEHLINPMYEAADFSFDFSSGEFYKDGELTNRMAPTEVKLFQALQSQTGKVLTKEALSNILFNEFNTGTVDKLKTYVFRLRRKMPVSKERSEEIVESIRGFGYRYNHFEKIDEEDNENA